MKLGSCDDSIAEGISYAYTCKEIKVYCKDCEHNDYLICNRFKKKVIIKNCFTDDKKHEWTYKSDLNPDGKCKHYQGKTSFLNKLIKKLWK